MNYKQTTIEKLPENMLLEIFDFYRLDAITLSGRPLWKWYRLAQVCQKWRRIMSMSPRRLGLRILCNSNVHVRDIMNFWPTLPVVVRYKNPEPSSFSRNITAALDHPDRVCEIDLDVTSLTFGSIFESIQEPFPSLERLTIEINCKDVTPPPVLTTFLGGSAPRLEEASLYGVAIPFPALRRLLLSTNNLVSLKLWNILNTCYFPPNALVTCLSALVHLEALWFSFGFPTPRPSSSWAHITLERPSLPSITSLKFRGTSEYLEGIMARINFPSLTSIGIGFFNQLVFEIPQLYQFMSRVDRLRSFGEVIVMPTGRRVSIILTHQEERPHNFGECRLEIDCRELDWQLSSVTQIFGQLSPLLSNVTTLVINKSSSPPIVQEYVDSIQWLELFQPFPKVREVRVIKELVPGVMQALATQVMAADMLPSLSSLHLKGFRQSLSVVEAAEQFAAIRKRSGRRIILSG